jgi:hypothetical protein
MTLTKERIIGICFNDLTQLWRDMPADFPKSMNAIPKETKALNEEFAKKTETLILEHFEKINSKWAKLFTFYRKCWAEKTEKLFNQFLHDETILHISNYFSSETISEISEELKKFLSAAKCFGLSVSDLGQAVRNYLIYVLILEASNKKQRYTPAIFGYSMLYPVTDNYSDGSFSDIEKHSFNTDFRVSFKNNRMSYILAVI